MGKINLELNAYDLAKNIEQAIKDNVVGCEEAVFAVMQKTKDNKYKICYTCGNGEEVIVTIKKRKVK